MEQNIGQYMSRSMHYRIDRLVGEDWEGVYRVPVTMEKDAKAAFLAAQTNDEGVPVRLIRVERETIDTVYVIKETEASDVRPEAVRPAPAPGP